MSYCNYTQQVSPNTCLGDSLPIFNLNFASLDEGLCEVPKLKSGPGIRMQISTDETGHPINNISSDSNIVYSPTFDYWSGTAVTDVTLSDSSVIKTLSFPGLSSSAYAVFSTASLTNIRPTVSILWTANGNDNLTVYATNSSLSPAISGRGNLWFNGPINSFYQSGSLLYVGGEFTQIGNVVNKKFGVIDLEQGTSALSLGYTGTLMSNPLSAFGDLGLNGSVNAITEFEDYLIVGGSFGSATEEADRGGKGRGLVIYNKSTDRTYPFYINGSVNDLMVADETLYVAGDFNYLNYTADSASDVSGQKIYANGLARIYLGFLFEYAHRSIDLRFAEYIRTTFDGPAHINALALNNGKLYVGGEFKIKTEEKITSQNIASFDATTTQYVSDWNKIIDGPVFALGVSGSILYVGGSFRKCYTQNEFYSNPRANYKASTSVDNALCFDLSVVVNGAPFIDPDWKPKFNGPVTKFAFPDNNPDGYIYCQGSFTKINGTQTGYAAAVEKAGSFRKGQNALWNVSLNVPPNLNNNAILCYGSSVIVGGNFNKVNSSYRYNLARVSGVNSSLLTTSLSSLTLNVGAQNCGTGMKLGMDFSVFTSVTSCVINTFETVHESSVTVPIQCEKGQLLRFFVTRPGLDDTFRENIYLLGWKVNFNS